MQIASTVRHGSGCEAVEANSPLVFRCPWKCAAEQSREWPGYTLINELLAEAIGKQTN